MRGNLNIFFLLDMLRPHPELSCRITADPDPVDLASTLFCKLGTERRRRTDTASGLGA